MAFKVFGLLLALCLVLLFCSVCLSQSSGAENGAGEAEVFSNLLDATARRDIDGIRQALDAGEPIDTTNVNGWTAASFAVAAGDYEALEELINAGIDLNIANVDGYTPLMLAALQVGYS